MEIVHELAEVRKRIVAEDQSGERMVKALTLREREIVGCIADGMSDNQIADHLFIAYQTVKCHMVNVRNKLGMDTRTEIAVAVYRHPALYAAIQIPSLQEGPSVAQR